MAGVAVSRSILADILVLIARSWVPARCPKKEIAAGDLWIDRANIRGRRRPSRFSRTQLPWLSGRATERLAILADLKAAGSYEQHCLHLVTNGLRHRHGGSTFRPRRVFAEAIAAISAYCGCVWGRSVGL